MKRNKFIADLIGGELTRKGRKAFLLKLLPSFLICIIIGILFTCYKAWQLHGWSMGLIKKGLLGAGFGVIGWVYLQIWQFMWGGGFTESKKTQKRWWE
jgi:hypothetical protein